MKQIIYILTFLILTGCGQLKSEQNTVSVSDTQFVLNSDTISKDNKINDQQKSAEENQNEGDDRKQSLNGFKKVTLYKLTDTISADFNGDGIIDKAFYRKENGTSGIIIKHGQTNEVIKIGFGKSFAHFTEFDWVDYWGLVEDRETSETTFTEDGDVLGSKEVKLQNHSIALGADEVGGGLITFINGKYVWIHQTC
ncbi:hypothetical protein LNP27_00945 [Flavobacterium galactosidilyticum]|uniref:hypothetical protein n=1 Tax=Flavobacterium galactosidilyticum TaxID=2893886 RepID=UPI001E4F7CF0|nr:hypothetical protein [Flavobacterium sp. F-340]UFH46619.1 hypothetical protein LNP27_00910 [Flavobacterium sp. F-340]UFH46625.1 hypothetical protein LNP27_00940 [Flavobacterium sp. F-340]UFH46626.1 hypothetical protein LNP27_00945 [Flavobacterium sp. F-340]